MENKKAFSLLTADLNSGRIANSYIFVGPAESDKRKIALEFAKALNCQMADSKWQMADDSKPLDIRHTPYAIRYQESAISNMSCGNCNSCQKIDSENHPDIFVLDFQSQAELLQLTQEKSERQKEFQIGAIRILVQRSVISPIEARKKVFVIDGAELLSQESGNALLKALEEPSRFSCWILLSANPERILTTVRSRCRKILCSSQLSEGSKGKFSGLEKIVEELLSGGREPLKTVMEVLADKKKRARNQAEEFLRILALRYSKKLREKPDEETADALSLILQSHEDLRRNTNPQFVLDALLTTLSSNTFATLSTSK